ncbi:hypothetical protein DIPPA_23443 [Diplonema papillatum]|nr:hypothetical protein DIPPA_23443 [Diplonema papillatum]
MTDLAPQNKELIEQLQLRQSEHAKCIDNAKNVGLDINDACSVTAWKAAEAYKDWARYRAPFKTPEALEQLANFNKKFEKNVEKSA